MVDLTVFPIFHTLLTPLFKGFFSHLLPAPLSFFYFLHSFPRGFSFYILCSKLFFFPFFLFLPVKPLRYQSPLTFSYCRSRSLFTPKSKRKRLPSPFPFFVNPPYRHSLLQELLVLSRNLDLCQSFPDLKSFPSPDCFFLLTAPPPNPLLFSQGPFRSRCPTPWFPLCFRFFGFFLHSLVLFPPFFRLPRNPPTPGKIGRCLWYLYR